MMYDVKFAFVDERYKDLLPVRAYAGDSGWDIYSREIDVWLSPGETKVIATGIRLELPPGLEAQCRPRSGKSREGLQVQFGTIDQPYRGEVGVIMHNASKSTRIIHRGDRIAQLVFAEVPQVTLTKVESVSESERGENGFGSTGR